MAAVLGVVLLASGPEGWRLEIVLLFLVPVGAFSIVTAYGLLRLRRWGWWCAVVWTSMFIADSGLCMVAARRRLRTVNTGRLPSLVSYCAPM